MRDPVLTGYSADLAARQAAATRPRTGSRSEARSEIALERRVHAPELERHQQQLDDLDGEIAEKYDTYEQKGRELVQLEEKRRQLAASPPWIAPSPYPDGRPLNVGDDPRDRRRWRLGGRR